MYSVVILDDWLLLNIKLGHSDLGFGFYGTKLTFLTYFNGNKICYNLMFLAHIMSCQLNLSLCDDLLSAVCLPACPSISQHWLHKSSGKTYRVHTWSVDTLGNWLLPIF